jgi:CIC family chloride channel protein
VVTGTAVAAYIGQLYFGSHPAFYIPALEIHSFVTANPALFLAFAGLGLITGLVSALFIRSIYGFEAFIEKRVKGGYYAQHLLGMLVVGCLMYAMMRNFGHYYLQGVGYATIQDVLGSAPLPLSMLLLLVVGKLLATSLTLGSGASGGVFSPALFIGATTGAAWGVMLNHFFPGLQVSPAAFAVAGMAGVVGGTTGAAMAAIAMIFEMTLDYNVIVPLTLTVAISYAVRRRLIRDSIYTRKLTLRGEPVPEAMRADVHLTGCASELMRAVDQEELDALVAGIPDGTPKEYVTVLERTPLSKVLATMRASDASVALVRSQNGPFLASDVTGVITHKDLLDTLAEDMELFD